MFEKNQIPKVSLFPTWMKTWAVIFALLALCGCRTPPLPAPPAESLGTDAATIVFIRVRCPPVAVKSILILDGVPRARMATREYVVLKCVPGSRELAVRFPGWAGTPSRKAIVDLAPSSTRYFVYTTSMGFLGGFVPVLTITPEIMELKKADAEKLMLEYAKADGGTS